MLYGSEAWWLPFHERGCEGYKICLIYRIWFLKSNRILGFEKKISMCNPGPEVLVSLGSLRIIDSCTRTSQSEFMQVECRNLCFIKLSQVILMHIEIWHYCWVSLTLYRIYRGAMIIFHGNPSYSWTILIFLR